jgi:hypothetical protein
MSNGTSGSNSDVSYVPKRSGSIVRQSHAANTLVLSQWERSQVTKLHTIDDRSRRIEDLNQML